MTTATPTTASSSDTKPNKFAQSILQMTNISEKLPVENPTDILKIAKENIAADIAKRTINCPEFLA